MEARDVGYGLFLCYIVTQRTRGRSRYDGSKQIHGENHKQDHTL